MVRLFTKRFAELPTGIIFRTIQPKKVKIAASAPAVNVPPSGQKPSGNLAPRDILKLAEALVAYHNQYADLYQRREQRQWAEFYLQGQLSDTERKTVEPMVLASKGRAANAIRAVQQFLGEGTWDDGAILARREQLVAQDIGEPAGVLICDGSGFPKKGEHSVGVAPQYCGAVGKIAKRPAGRLSGLRQQSRPHFCGSALVSAASLVQCCVRREAKALRSAR